MRIYITDRRETREITLKAWKAGNWSPDMFSDIADTLPRDYPIAEADRDEYEAEAAMTAEQFAEEIKWWEAEVEKYNKRDGSSWFFESADPEDASDELALDWETVRCDTVTRTWKIYGLEGHRQQMSFGESVSYDWTKAGDVRIVSLECEDKTGTNDFVRVIITRNSAEECQDELDAQITDGLFENARVGKIEEA